MIKKKDYKTREFANCVDLTLSQVDKLISDGVLQCKKNSRIVIPYSEVVKYKRLSDKLNKMMTTSQCAEYCGVPMRYIIANIEHGKLKAEKFLGRYYISKYCAERFYNIVNCPNGYTIKEAAEIIGISEKSFIMHIYNGHHTVNMSYGRYIVSEENLKMFKMLYGDRQKLDEFEKNKMREFYKKLLLNCPDAMYVADIVDITGYSTKTIVRIVKMSQTPFVALNKRCTFIFAKEDVIEMLISTEYNNIRSKSPKHLEALKEIAQTI